MARKTVEVVYLLEKANYFMANSEPEQKGERAGMAMMIECVLHKADAYKGFGYLESAGLRKNPTYNEAWERHRASVEIRKANGLNTEIAYPEWNDYCADDTRRFYYKHPKLPSLEA